jgi:Icc protein
MNRRSFLQLTTAAGAAIATGCAPSTAPKQSAGSAEEWSFVHFTDPHIQPELKADEGCKLAFRTITKRKPDFAISGGDLVFDALAVDRPKADSLFTLYKEAAKHLEVPQYNTIGNHDVFGLYTKSGIAPTDPMYGKKLYEDLIGPRYHSFDHKGWHFISLDSIGMTLERQYIGQIDDEQLTWLKNDLEKTGTSTPVVVVTHIPLLSAFPQTILEPGASTAGILITNVREVLEVLKPYNVKMVLQGHTHICERLEYQGTQYITSGAISANWWKGPRFGFAEGYTVLTVKGDEISWSYETYGWNAEVPA